MKLHAGTEVWLHALLVAIWMSVVRFSPDSFMFGGKRYHKLLC